MYVLLVVDADANPVKPVAPDNYEKNLFLLNFDCFFNQKFGKRLKPPPISDVAFTLPTGRLTALLLSNCAH